MTKPGEKMLNFDVPQAVWDRWDEFCKSQPMHKKDLGAWAIHAFMQSFTIERSGEIQRAYDAWLAAGAPAPQRRPEPTLAQQFERLLRIGDPKEPNAADRLVEQLRAQLETEDDPQAVKNLNRKIEALLELAREDPPANRLAAD